MLRLSLILFAAVGLLGFALAALHLRQARRAPPALLRWAHGLLGAAGLAVLLAQMRGPALTGSLSGGSASGDPTFRMDAAVLLGAALVLGLAILAMVRFAPKSAGAVIVLHATVAMFGLAILAAYVSTG
jgi:hypothetical protein